MNLKTFSLAVAVVLSASTTAFAQQTRQTLTTESKQQPKHASDSSLPAKPKPCVEFDAMAARLEGVTITEEITASEFASAAAQPKVVIRNPGKVFDLGNVEYVAEGDDNSPTYMKFTTHKDKQSEFLKWYNHEGQGDMYYRALSCSTQYMNQVLESGDKGVQRTLLLQQLQMWMSFSQATSIASAADDELLQAALAYGSEGFQETMRLRDRYNKLVENYNAYNGAVENLMTVVNDILKTHRTAAPRLNFDFVPAKPITCTGNTLAFSNSTNYPGGRNTITNANTTIHCE